MSLFALLKKDHQDVVEIMKKIRQTGDRSKQKRQELFASLKADLDAHTEAEEQIFYSGLEDFDETRELIADARDEHEEVKRFLEELEGMATDDEEWKGKFEILMEAVEHHIKEEEREIFRAAKEVLSREQLDDMEEEFKEAKSELEG